MFYKLYFKLSNFISFQAIFTITSNHSSSFHSKKKSVETFFSCKIKSTLDCIFLKIHNLSSTSITLATHSSFAKSVILTICSSLLPLATNL